MDLEIYQIDAFADKPFNGNPAAVVPLAEWLDDKVMQSIAAENNLSETAFFVKDADRYDIRWFTPLAEVDLCGHATLASAYVIFNELNDDSETILFDSKSGFLSVEKRTESAFDKGQFVLDFPCQAPVICDSPEGLSEALGVKITECLKNGIYVVVLDNEKQVVGLNPNFSKLSELDVRGIIVTAPSENYDFVNRYFAPSIGIDEDPVTGSAFTKLIPYWAERLKKNRMHAKQVSQRGGEVSSELIGDRVKIAGTAIKYMQGKLFLPDSL